MTPCSKLVHFGSTDVALTSDDVMRLAGSDERNTGPSSTRSEQSERIVGAEGTEPDSGAVAHRARAPQGRDQVLRYEPGA